MKCSNVYLYICTNLDADLNSARCRRIKKHIAGCPDCSAYLDSLRKTIHLYKEYPTPHIPKSVHNRLFKAIRMVEHESPLVAKHSMRSRTKTKK
jgi:hypothetical protein